MREEIEQLRKEGIPDEMIACKLGIEITEVHDVS